MSWAGIKNTIQKSKNEFVNKSKEKINISYKANTSLNNKKDDILKSELIDYKSYEPNIVDEYSNVTYYFHIYMISEKDYKSWDMNKKSLIHYKKETIYQTGITDYLSLERVNINSLIGSNGNTHNIFDQVINIDIKEPMGFSFIDDIYQNCYRLGYPTHMQVPIFIDFHLIGYNSQNNPEIIPNSQKIIVASINTFTPKLDISGSKYHISLLSIENLATQKDVFNLSNAVSIDEKIIDVDSFFNKLQEKMNKIYKDNTPKNISQLCPEIYIFDVDSSLKKEVINKNIIKSSGDNTGSSTWNFTAGTSIQTICDKLLSSLESYKVNVSVNNDSQNKADDLWSIKVIPEIKYINKSLDNNQLIYKYIYHIRKYYNPSVIVKSNEKQNPYCLNFIKQHGLLKKRYDFIYTGMNDQVFDVNLNIDNTWFAKSTNKASEKSKNDTTSQENIISNNKVVGKDAKVYKVSSNNSSGDKFKTESGLKTTIKEEPSYMEDTGNTGDKITGQDIKNKSIYNQIYNTTGMQELNLTIKGDPYWYFPKDTIDELPCNKGQLAILFQAKSPKKYGMTNDLVENIAKKYDESITLCGVYMIQSVSHNFERGTFKQTLKGLYNHNIRFEYTYSPTL